MRYANKNKPGTVTAFPEIRRFHLTLTVDGKWSADFPLKH